MKVLSIQTGPAKPMTIGSRSVMTGIGKTPVDGRVGVTTLGLEGDEQADRSVHGGLQKAVYAYPSEHYGYWRAQATPAATLPYGSLGENLTLSGLLETEVFVGDELRFDDCVLRVTQPRLPCFKFNAVMNDRLAGKKMAQTGFSGFYLSVVEEGSIAAGQTFELLPGAREVAITALAAVGKLKTRND
jgi:MOSC domain-containing protein YiiM